MKRVLSIVFAGLLVTVLLSGCKTLDSVREAVKQTVDIGFSAYEDVRDALKDVKEAIVGDGESGKKAEDGQG